MGFFKRSLDWLAGVAAGVAVGIVRQDSHHPPLAACGPPLPQVTPIKILPANHRCSLPTKKVEGDNLAPHAPFRWSFTPAAPVIGHAWLKSRQPSKTQSVNVRVLGELMFSFSNSKARRNDNCGPLKGFGQQGLDIWLDSDFTIDRVYGFKRWEKVCVHHGSRLGRYFLFCFL